MLIEIEDSAPENCRHCVNNKECYTYFASETCRKKWKKIEESEIKE